MTDSLTFLYTFFFLSIILHLLSAFITAGFVIPLQLKQAGVKNGLAKLRKQMVFLGFADLGTSIVSILALTMRFFISDPDLLRYLITTSIFAHSFGFFLRAYTFYRIYHQEYSEENKKIHEEIHERKRQQ